MFDFIENLALPQRVEKIQSSLQAQAERLRKQQTRLKSTGISTRDRMVEEWRRRVQTPEEQLEKYRKRMRTSVDRLSERWNERTAVTAREKASFIAGVMNIFISGYLIGAHPNWFPTWYTVQLLYFMPVRFYTYHKRGYHYFLADLCYFVNLLVVLSIWVFPNSKRLFISSYCLAMGNNAIAIAMWRNSLVFHSMDKVVR
jgi:tetrahydromethanopterin S-methyltransferase subunit B